MKNHKEYIIKNFFKRPFYPNTKYLFFNEIGVYNFKNDINKKSSYNFFIMPFGLKARFQNNIGPGPVTEGFEVGRFFQKNKQLFNKHEVWSKSRSPYFNTKKISFSKLKQIINPIPFIKNPILFVPNEDLTPIPTLVIDADRFNITTTEIGWFMELWNRNPKITNILKNVFFGFVPLPLGNFVTLFAGLALVGKDLDALEKLTKSSFLEKLFYAFRESGLDEVSEIQISDCVEFELGFGYFCKNINTELFLSKNGMGFSVSVSYAGFVVIQRVKSLIDTQRTFRVILYPTVTPGVPLMRANLDGFRRISGKEVDEVIHTTTLTSNKEAIFQLKPIIDKWKKPIDCDEKDVFTFRVKDVSDQLQTDLFPLTEAYSYFVDYLRDDSEGPDLDKPVDPIPTNPWWFRALEK
jgi:hypothetical protein